MALGRLSAYLFIPLVAALALPAGADTVLAEAPPTDAAPVQLTLEKGIANALENNLEIRVQRAKPLAGEQDQYIAEGEFDPLLFATMGYYRTQSPSSSPLANPQVSETKGTTTSVGIQQKFTFGTSYKLSFDTTKADTNSTFTSLNPSYTSNLELALTQPLLKNMGGEAGRTRMTLAQKAKTMSDEEFARKVMDVVTRTEQAYWDLVYLQKELAVQEEALERARDFKRQIDLKVQVGVLAPIETTAAEAQVATQAEALIAVRHAIRTSQDNLKLLMNSSGIPLGSEAAILPMDEPTLLDTELNMERLKETAYEKRPDYHQARLALESKQAEWDYNRNQSLPTLNLTGAVKYHGLRGTPQSVTFGGQVVTSSLGGTQTDSATDVGRGKYYDWSVGLQFEYPLFNRTAESRAMKSQVEADAARTSEAALKQTIDLQVLAAARSVEAARQTIDATRLSRLLAEKKLDAENRKFQVGTSTPFAVLQYQKDLAAAKSKEVKAMTDHLKALAQLSFATGTTLDRHNIALAAQGQ